MFLSRHKSAVNWIVVNILNLLRDRFVGIDFLRKRSLLPNLMSTLRLMLGSEILELVEQPFVALLLQLLKNPLCRCAA